MRLDICELLQKTCAVSRPTGDARGEAPLSFVKILLDKIRQNGYNRYNGAK